MNKVILTHEFDTSVFQVWRYSWNFHYITYNSYPFFRKKYFSITVNWLWIFLILIQLAPNVLWVFLIQPAGILLIVIKLLCGRVLGRIGVSWRLICWINENLYLHIYICIFMFIYGKINENILYLSHLTHYSVLVMLSFSYTQLIDVIIC